MEQDVQAMRAVMRYSPKVLENTTIDTTPCILYHISPTDDIKEFVPRKVQRAMPGEDKTVARVCTAPTLLDCIRGYAVTVDDYLQEEEGEVGAAGKHEWRGGYYIYAIPTNVNLVVTEKLAPIAKWCDERWLIDVEERGQKYPAKIIGQVFYTRANGEEFADVMMYIRLFDNLDEMMPFDSKLMLGKGCHAVEVKNLDAYYKKGSITRTAKHRVIPLGEFLKAKKVKADLLCYDQPAWTGWE